jgi:hypothetical protein
MEMTADYRVLTTRVRALSLRAIVRAGGELNMWQLRWALEPLLCDHVVPGSPMPELDYDQHVAKQAATATSSSSRRAGRPATWE